MGQCGNILRTLQLRIGRWLAGYRSLVRLPKTQCSLKGGIRHQKLRARGVVCKDFENDGRAHSKPLAEFETIKRSLAAKILYRIDPDKDCLLQPQFSELRKFK